MSTGPEHYRRAEQILGELNDAAPKVFGPTMDTAQAVFSASLATAQVHATLALAAATALGSGGVYITPGTAEAWRAAIGAESIDSEIFGKAGQ
jgi:hypothetical protein